RAVVVPADERPFEDLPVVAADVEGVADRKDEEEQEERHRQRDEAVAHERLAGPLGTEPAHLPSFRDCDRHALSFDGPSPRVPTDARGVSPLDQPCLAAAAIFESMVFTDSLPSMTAVSSLFATSFQTWRNPTWLPQPWVNCGYLVKALRPATAC